MKRKIISIIFAILLSFSMVFWLAFFTGCPVTNATSTPSDETSSSVSVSPPTTTPNRPVDDREIFIYQAANGNMHVTWDDVPGAISYQVYHATSRLSEKTLLSIVHTSEFIHTNPHENRFRNYYTIVPMDAEGRAIVAVSWNYVDNAQEYAIYFRNSSEQEWHHLYTQPAGSFMERGVFAALIPNFVLDETEFLITPLNHTASSGGTAGGPSRVGGNPAADSWFAVPRTVPGYGAGSSPAFTPAAPRMIDNWRNQSTARADRTNYQGYNIVSRFEYPRTISFHHQLFGEHFFVFWPDDCTWEIQREVNRVGDAMRTHANVAQFAQERYAFYFMPGDFDFEGIGARLNIGFYMTISGLGRDPRDTTLNFASGRSGVFTPVALTLWNELGNASTQGRNGTHNFWRKAENFQINGLLEWSVSQAAPIRRIAANGVTNFHYVGGWVSGGFAADMRFNGAVSAGSQQQWYTRSSHFGSGAISGGAWNIFTNASTGAAHPNNYMTGGINTWLTPDMPWLYDTPDMQWINNPTGMEYFREKPFLYFDTETNRYMVFVPGWRENAIGPSWGGEPGTDTYGAGLGTSIDLEDYFFIAREGDNAEIINAHLDYGYNLLLAPAMFVAEDPIFVGNENTIVLGTGMATVAPGRTNYEGAIMVSDVGGVVVASIVLDAHYMSKYLIRVGEVGADRDHSNNPTFVSDVFVRVGGQVHHAIHTEVSVQINSNNVVGDHFWIWRGDHGRGIRWDRNVGTFGLVVLGDDVTMHGLFVEHYQKYQTVWRGERGRIYFYQSETPYEFPFQVWSHTVGRPREEWTRGWADIKICNEVEYFFAYCLGFYGVHNQFAMVRENAVEAPHRPGVMFRDLFTNEIGGAGGGGNGRTLRVINGTGDCTEDGPGGRTTRRHIRVFHNGEVVTTSPNNVALEPLCGDLDYLLQWVMQPCGTGVPEGWDPVWNMRPPTWTTARATGFWPQGGGN